MILILCWPLSPPHPMRVCLTSSRNRLLRSAGSRHQRNGIDSATAHYAHPSLHYTSSSPTYLSVIDESPDTLNRRRKAIVMSYAYLFKYIIIGDTGNTRIPISICSPLFCPYEIHTDLYWLGSYRVASGQEGATAPVETILHSFMLTCSPVLTEFQHTQRSLKVWLAVTSASEITRNWSLERVRLSMSTPNECRNNSSVFNPEPWGLPDILGSHDLT